MKKLIVLLVLIVGTSTAFTQTSDSLQKRNSGFGKLTFQVELEKTSYLPFEPMAVTFLATNQTSEPLAVDRPRFLLDSSLEVTNPKGETKFIGSLSRTSGGGPLLPRIPILQPSQGYGDESLISVSPDVFAEPGIYKLQFELSDSFGEDIILKSNVVEITIESPQGIDKDAFDYLNQHGRDVEFGGDVYQTEQGEALLEAFIQKYYGSIYVEPAVARLAVRYKFSGKLEKAKAQFEKLKLSKNKMFSESAKRNLVEIASKIEQESKPKTQ